MRRSYSSHYLSKRNTCCSCLLVDDHNFRKYKRVGIAAGSAVGETEGVAVGGAVGVAVGAMVGETA